MHTPGAAGKNPRGHRARPLTAQSENTARTVRWDRRRPPTFGRTRQPPLRALVREPRHPRHLACLPFAGGDCPHAAPASRSFLDSRTAPLQPPEPASGCGRGQRERRRGPGRDAVAKARARALEWGGRRERRGREGAGGGGEGSPGSGSAGPALQSRANPELRQQVRVLAAGSRQLPGLPLLWPRREGEGGKGRGRSLFAGCLPWRTRILQLTFMSQAGEPDDHPLGSAGSSAPDWGSACHMLLIYFCKLSWFGSSCRCFPSYSLPLCAILHLLIKHESWGCGRFASEGNPIAV